MLLSLFSAAALTATAQLNGTPDRCRALLQGPVCKVREYSIREISYYHADTLAKYQALGKELPRFTRDLSSVTTYNRRGDVVESETFGFAAAKEVYLYADDGRRLCQRRYRDGSLAREYVFVYDDRNRLVSAEATGDDGVIFKEIYTNTDTVGGRILRCRHISVLNPGSGDSESVVTYSADGRMTRLVQKSARMLMDAELDDTEYPVKVTTTTPSGKSYAEYNPDLNQGRVYTVGEDGRYRLSGIREYDIYRNEKASATYDSDRNVTGETVTTYDYDSHGNWIRRERTSSDGLRTVTERELEYY